MDKMWAKINPLVQNFSRLQLFAVGLLFATALGFLQAAVAHAADGVWFNENGLIGVQTSDGKFYNPKEENGEWFVEENRGGTIPCQRKIVFPGNPNTSSSAASTGSLRVYKVQQSEDAPCVEDQDKRKAITISGTPSNPSGEQPGDSTGEDGDANEPICQVGALGWIICPLINFMGTATGQAATILQGLLFVQPLSLDTGSSSNVLFQAWSSLLGIANVMLAIAFLFVIFAQASSMALSSYGVKKMLPRIIAAAILMNLSYYICAFAVDLSNLAGIGVTGLLVGISEQSINGDMFRPENLGSKIGNSGIAEAIAGIGVGAIVVMFALTPVLLGILAVLFTLAARLAIIVLLVMVAPLAFAAWILPNTEKYFKKWYEMFISMLVLFPLVMAVFGAASLASQMIMANTAIKNTQNDAVGITPEFTESVLVPIIALIVQAMPLFMLPFLFKTASTALARINDMTKGYAQKGWDSDFASRKRQNTAARMVGNKLGRDAEGNPLGTKRAKFMRGIGAGATFAGGYSARRKFKLDSQKANAERIQQEGVAKAVLKSNTNNPLGLARGAGGAAGAAGMDRSRAAAASIVSKQEAEVAQNRVQMLQYQANQSGLDVKSYAKQVIANEQKAAKAQGAAYHPSSNMYAATDYAASAGEVPLLDDIRRINNNQLQRATSAAIARNDGPIKGKGGYYLASDLKLNAQDYKSSAAFSHLTEGMTDTQKQGVSFENTLQHAKLTSLIGGSSADIVGAKYGTIAGLPDAVAQGSFERLKQGERVAFINTIDQALRNENISGSLTEKRPYMEEALKSAVQIQQSIDPSYQAPPSYTGSTGPAVASPSASAAPSTPPPAGASGGFSGNVTGSGLWVANPRPNAGPAAQSPQAPTGSTPTNPGPGAPSPTPGPTPPQNNNPGPQGPAGPAGPSGGTPMPPAPGPIYYTGGAPGGGGNAQPQVVVNNNTSVTPPAGGNPVSSGSGFTGGTGNSGSLSSKDIAKIGNAARDTSGLNEIKDEMRTDRRERNDQPPAIGEFGGDTSIRHDKDN